MKAGLSPWPRAGTVVFRKRAPGQSTHHGYFDLDGRMSKIESAANLDPTVYGYDDASRVTSVGKLTAGVPDPARSATYGYDLLDRLTSMAPGAGNPAPALGIGYDAIGNRQTKTSTPELSPVAANQTLVFTYGGKSRPTSVAVDGVVTEFGINSLGERVKKATGAEGTRFFYDEAGQLVGEYDLQGNLITEYVWHGAMPVAVIKPTQGGAKEVSYVHADMLGTPRAVTRVADNALLWKWDLNEPFGSNPANENPAGLGPFKFPLRHPGQYEDNETGLFYNYFRDYDPAVGRYIQSDPIGLAAGINTYIYVSANPLSSWDPTGTTDDSILNPGSPPIGLPNPSADAQRELARQLTDLLRRNFPQRTYQTYTRYNPLTGKCYSGRTSGYDEPQTNIRNRALGQPLLNAEGFSPPVLDRSSGNYSSIRGREQQLIDINGGAQSAGGTSRNMINGISPYNPFRPMYFDDANAEFGSPVPAGNCTCR